MIWEKIPWKAYKIFLIVFAVLLYWVLIYYPYHDTDVAPLTLIFGGAVLFLIGIYAFFFEKSVKFNDVKIAFIFLFIIGIVDIAFMVISMMHHGVLDSIDKTIFLVYKYTGIYGVITMYLLSYPSYFFMLIGSHRALGKEYIYLWIMILLALIHSGSIVLFNYII